MQAYPPALAGVHDPAQLLTRVSSCLHLLLVVPAAFRPQLPFILREAARPQASLPVLLPNGLPDFTLRSPHSCPTSCTLQAAQLLLVLAHGSSAAQAFLGRRDTLQGLLEAMAQAEQPLLALLLQVVRRLSMEPLLLQPLQVSCCLCTLLHAGSCARV